MVKSHKIYMERPELCRFDERKFESIFIEIPRRGKRSIIECQGEGKKILWKSMKYRGESQFD